MGFIRSLFGLPDLDPLEKRRQEVCSFATRHVEACSALMHDRLQKMSPAEERGFLAFILGVLEYSYDSFGLDTDDESVNRELNIRSEGFRQLLATYADRKFPPSIAEQVKSFWLDLLKNTSMLDERRLGFESVNNYSNPDGSRREGHYPGRYLRDAIDNAATPQLKLTTDGDASPETIYAVGRAHEKGDGVEQDYAKSLACYRKAAEMRHAPALLSLGAAYDEGRGVPRNPTEAIRCFREAAELGEPRAQTLLAVALASGIGVAKDIAEAHDWYQLAATAGDPIAQLSLGELHYNGTGVLQDYVEAAQWFSKAAAQGKAKAQLYLGILYSKGLGVTQDYVEAHKWLNIVAAAQSAPNSVRTDAEKVRSELTARMTPAQLTEAQQRAREWRKSSTD